MVEGLVFWDVLHHKKCDRSINRVCYAEVGGRECLVPLTQDARKKAMLGFVRSALGSVAAIYTRHVELYCFGRCQFNQVLSIELSLISTVSNAAMPDFTLNTARSSC